MRRPLRSAVALFALLLAPLAPVVLTGCEPAVEDGVIEQDPGAAEAGAPHGPGE